MKYETVSDLVSSMLEHLMNEAPWFLQSDVAMKVLAEAETDEEFILIAREVLEEGL